jgi:hypothetical protein
MLLCDDEDGAGALMAADLHARLAARGVYRPEAPALAAARHRGPFPPRAGAAAAASARTNVRSVRRGCLSVSTGSRRGAVRGPRIGVDEPSLSPTHLGG